MIQRVMTLKVPKFLFSFERLGDKFFCFKEKVFEKWIIL